MRVYILSLLIILFAGFSSLQSGTVKNWVFAFKAESCAACLKASGVIIGKDNSSWLRFEVLGIEAVNLADSLGKSYADTITNKSKYFKNSDLEGGEAITNGCLLFFESKQLQKEAQKAYLKFRNKDE